MIGEKRDKYLDFQPSNIAPMRSMIFWKSFDFILSWIEGDQRYLPKLIVVGILNIVEISSTTLLFTLFEKKNTGLHGANFLIGLGTKLTKAAHDDSNLGY